jgi:SWI/SNF-related matrix-associated actin-dependent regulator 1 of chromatin subfamily A
MKAHYYTISGGFASRERLPIIIQATELAETAKAVYLYGGGSIEHARRVGKCCRCGRALTHPGSIALGIGPECLGNWDMHYIVLDSMTQADIDALTAKIRAQQKVDSWIPKAVILNKEDAPDMAVPADHRMLQKATEAKPTKPAVEKTNDGKLIVRFPYDPEKIAAIKTVTGRRWNSEKKFWTVPHTGQAVEVLKRIGLDTPEISTPEMPKAPNRSEINMTGFGRQLMPFQREGVEFLFSKNGRAIIGSEMGLGKTIQALAYIHANPDKLPALVICPASLKLNWAREAQIACPTLSIHIINGGTQYQLPKADLYIINYDIVADKREKKKVMGPKGMKTISVPIPNTGWWNSLTHCKLMVLDEAHALKNSKTNRTKDILGRNAKQRCLSSIPHIVALTGTPILNRPIEIYPVVKTLAPAEIPPFKLFALRYCNAKHNGFGWDFSGSSNTEELNDLLKSVMIRHLKKDVLKDLPDKTTTVIPMELDKKTALEYRKASADFIQWLRGINPEKVSAAERAETLVQFQALKRLAARGKWESMMEWVKDTLDTNGKLILFAVHHEAIDNLMKTLEGYNPVKIDGRDNQEQRQSAVDRFQNDEACRVFVGNIKAAGVGLTLTAADTVVFTELGWTPGEHAQAANRPHRIGQKNAVSVYYLIAQGTIEEEIAALLDKKQKVLDAVLDGTETSQESLLTELFTKYINESKKVLTN